MEFRKRFDPSVKVRKKFPEQGRTKQQFKDECDINNILRRYEKTGALPNMIKSNPVYGDFSNVADFQDSLELVRFAEEQFAGLSAKLRRRFNNDPAEFLAFCEDPENVEEMVSLGLATKRAADTVPGGNDGDKRSDGKVPAQGQKKGKARAGGGVAPVATDVGEDRESGGSES